MGTLGALTDEARARAATLASGAAELKRVADRMSDVPGFGAALRVTK